jgi:flagellar basal-body rod modification protein FlgD
MDIGGVGTAVATEYSATAAKEEAIGKDAFLKLLVVQLENQDPLNPMDSTEFVAQLAQLSSLEGITNLGVSMEKMAGSVSSMQNLSTSSLIGRNVMVEGNGIEYKDAPVVFGYDLEGGAASVTVSIYDGSSMLVSQVNLGPSGSGDKSFTWDGTDDNGVQAAPGLYTFDIEAKDAKDETVFVVPYAAGVVSSVTFDGSTALLTVGGKTITQDKIKEIF